MKGGRRIAGAERAAVPALESGKIHVAASDTPLQSGVEQRAVCGMVIPRAAWLWTAGVPMGSGSGSKAKALFMSEIFIRGCPMCARCWVEDWPGGYLYALVAGK